MSKELTEQWRNGTLPVGHYYCKLYYNGFKEKIQECVKSAYSLKSCIPMSCGCEGEEVLASVPTYDQFSQLVKKVEKLERQLESANKCIKIYAKGRTGFIGNLLVYTKTIMQNTILKSGE